MPLKRRCPFCELRIPKVKIKKGPMKGRYYHPFTPGHSAVKKAKEFGVNVRRRHAPCIIEIDYGYIAQKHYFPSIQPFAELLDRIDKDKKEKHIRESRRNRSKKK